MVQNHQSTDLIPNAGLAAITKKRLNSPVTKRRLENALRIMAGIIADGDHQYLPIFLRLEQELVSCTEKDNAIERAKRISHRELNLAPETNLHTDLDTN